MKMLAVGFAVGLLAGVVGSGWSYRMYFDDLDPGIDALHKKVEELHTTVKLIEGLQNRALQAQNMALQAQRNRPSRQEIHEIVMHSIHGCHAVGYNNANMYTIECPIN